MAITDPKSQLELVHETFTRAYNTGDVDAIDEICADNFVAFHTAYEEPIRSVADYKRHIEEIRAAFPDMKMERIETLYDGEKSAALYRWTGTHEGDFQGVPATEKHITVDSLTMGTVDADAKLVELRVFGDSGAMMRQLGVAPRD